MAEHPPQPGSHPLGERLRAARVAAGLSTRAFAERLAPRLCVTHATLANYERGDTRPSLEIVTAIANELGRPLTWFLRSGEALRNVRYRNRKSLVSRTATLQFEYSSQMWLDAYAYVEQLLGESLHSQSKFSLETITTTSPSRAASEVRNLCGFGDDPIPAMPRLLEQFGIRVIEIDTNAAIDGLAALFGEEGVVVLARGLEGDRSRLNAAHELGHFAFGDVFRQQAPPKADERAFEFGSHLLLPSKVLRAAFARESMVHLVDVKKQYRVSLAAMVYRARSEGLLTASEAKGIWVDFARRGWRNREPGQVAPDRAVRFEEMLERAIVSKQLTTFEGVANHSGLRPSEVERRLAQTVGYLDEPISPPRSSGSRGLRLVRWDTGTEPSND